MRKVLVVAILVVGTGPSCFYPFMTKRGDPMIVGRAIDHETGDGIAGASVLVVGTTLGAMTDSIGFFQIYRVPVGKYVLRFGCVGYTLVETDSVAVTGDTCAVVEIVSSPQEVNWEKVIF